jgi:hypothetical protein
MGGETDLVVEDDMDDTSGTVIYEVLELERLPNDSLTCHCSITMDDYS